MLATLAVTEIMCLCKSDHVCLDTAHGSNCLKAGDSMRIIVLCNKTDDMKQSSTLQGGMSDILRFKQSF